MHVFINFQFVGYNQPKKTSLHHEEGIDQALTDEVERKPEATITCHI